MNRLARLFSLAALRRHALLLATFLLTAPLLAYTSGNFTYSVANGEAVITDFYTSYSGALTIPSTLGGYPVTKIGNKAFDYCRALTSVVIPASVTSIGSGAFQGCSSLTSVVIPASVTSIGSGAFQGCSSLTSVVIPASVTSIGDVAFYKCSSLTSVVIPASVTSIGYLAFAGCNVLVITVSSGNTSYASVEGVLFNKAFTKLVSAPSVKGDYSIPASVTSIDGGAFNGCSALTSVVIPSSVTSIGDGAFEGCSSLTSVVIPEGVTSIGNYVFYDCWRLTSVEIPVGVTSIGDYVFYDCWRLTSVVIPEGVTKIGGGAFYGCSSLTSVVIPASVTAIGYAAFYGCSSLTSVTIPASVRSIGDGAFEGVAPVTLVAAGVPNGMLTTNLTSVTIPASVTAIGDEAFAGVAPATLVATAVPSGMSTRNLTSVTIPEGGTSIGNYAFSGCGLLTSVVIPEGVTSIGNYAFRNCSSLTSVVIPEGVTSIGDSAFSGCSSLTSVAIPEGVTSIGDSAFSGCSSLTSVAIPEGVTSIGDSAFSGCSSLTLVVIPEGVTSIGASAFKNCSSLTSITIPNSVTMIGSNAFEGVAPEMLIASRFPAGSRMLAEKLTTVIVPEGTKSIEAKAFAGCSALTSVMIPSSVTEIGEGAFTDVAPERLVAPFLPSGMSTAKLTEVTLTTAATVIAEEAFAGNTVLQSIVFPAGVTSIGARAFKGCSALERVTIPASVTEIGAGAFRECTGLTEVVFAEGLTKIGDEAFWGCSAVEEMVLPASVTKLGDRVFTGCNRVLVAEVNRNYKSVDGVLFSANNEWLLHFPVYQGGEYATPVNVHFIGEEAFMGNTALNFVYLADITTLDPRAFKDCSGLIYCFATEGLLTIQANAFENATSLRAFTVPASVSRLEVGAFKNCTSLSLVAFRGTVPERTGTVFSGMNLDQMRSTYPTEYAATWEEALDGSLMWDGLKMVADSYYTGTSGNYKYRALGGEAIITGSTIPLSGAVRLPMMLDDYLVTGIDARAFVTSTGLTDITFPRSLLSIGDNAFAFCTKLQSVTFEGAPLTKGTTPTQPFPANTTAIGNYPAELEEAWSQVIEAGYYYGLRMGLVEVLAILGGGEGEVLGTGSYHIGEEVTLTAVPATGNHFVQWMFLDGKTSTENPITFTADEACYVMVTFEADPAPIVTSNITYENLMGATHRNPATYEEGTEYVFTTPSEVTGYTFQGWQPAAIDSSMTGDQTIRATWRANGYTVVYAANGGMGSMENTSAVYGTPFTLSANAFTRSGYTFAGWATSATGGALYINGAEVSNLTATANGTVTLYAVWAGNAYTIAYHANGGSGTIPEAHVHYGQATTLAQNGFARPGYTFAGWATSPTGAMAYAPGATVSNLASEAGATITLYALWQVNAYTIVYNANGGEGAMENSSAVYDTPFTLRASTFSRLGYTFKGWATAPQGEVLYADGAAVSNLTEVANGVVPLYAVWEVNAYTIDYIANGGEGEMASTVATYGEGIRLPMMAFTRVGYTFQGWATAPQGEVLYADGAEVRDLTSVAGGTVTLYAVWELNSYTIAYRANGGEGTMTATSATYGQSIALSANTFSREGYTFQGWSTEAEGSVVYADGAEVVNLTEQANQEVALYALWQANSYTIAYNANGGEGEMASTPATYDESLQLPANRFARTGYTFVGWALEATGEEVYADGAEVENLTLEVNGTVTLYAIWQANTYTIAYDANGGKGEMAGTLAEYNATVTLRENAFTRVGCAFVGWATEAEGTLRYRDGAEVRNLTAEADGTVTLYALWQTEEYTEGCFSYTLSEAGATLVEYDDEASGASAHVVVPNTLGGYPVIAIGLPGELGDDDYSGFSSCHNVVTVTLPATVTTIYDEAFANCSRLESVTIPASVTFLDDGASWGSPNLRYIVDLANACYASDEHGYLYNKDRTVLMAAPTARGDFVVPDGVVEISECAFFYSRFNSITSVTLPASVRRVCDWAFLECYNLKTVHFKGEPLDYCGEWAFGDDDLSGTYLPEYQDVWQANLSNGTWQNLTMSLYLTEPTVEGDPDAVVETDENGQITVKPSGGVEDVVISIPEGVEAAKVTVEVPSAVTSVTANGATIKVVKVEGDKRHDITPFLNIPAAVAGKIDLTQAEVKAEIAKAILDTSEAGGAVFDPSAKQPLTTAATKPGLTYTLLEGDSLDNLKEEGDSKVGDGQPWQPQVTKRGPSAFYCIRVSK
ncbi:MAG: leucine-rich repeat protein [Candidatus Spyradenecus sp.]